MRPSSLTSHLSRAALSLVCSAALVVIGCGPDDNASYSSADVIDESPSGIVDGVEWSGAYARVRRAGHRLRVSLFPGELDDCNRGAASGSHVLFDVPDMEGEYPLSLDFGAVSERRVVTFVTAAGAKVLGAQGLIVIDSSDDEHVALGIIADADDRNFINGRVVTTFCDEDE